MSIRHKAWLIGVLRGFNYVGLIVMIILNFIILTKISEQAVMNHTDTASAVKQIENDHARQDKLLRCLVNLFISPAEAVTKAQSDACVATTKDVANTIPAGTTNTTTTTSTTTRPPKTSGTVPATSSTVSTQPNTTTSAPPPDPSPSNPTGIQPLDNVLNKIGL